VGYLFRSFSTHLEKSDVNQAGIIIGGIEARHVDGVTALVPRVVRRAIRVLGEPLGHAAVPAMDGHDGRELDESGARGGHDRLPTAQVAAVGVVQQEETVLPVAVVVAISRCRRLSAAAAAVVLVEHGHHEPPDDPAAVHDDQYGHRGHGGQCREKRQRP